jgi:ectoine hydroxylase-related dioxygenase (phytanoyl-CoA dioxygenase family)
MAATAEPVNLDLSAHIRDVTDEEVEAFREQGWVTCEGFISEDLAGEILEHYKAWSGVRWDEWPDDPAEQREFIDVIVGKSGGKRMFAARQEDPWMFNYVSQRQIGKAAARLLGVKTIRPLSETLQAKFPASSGHSKPFEWHQDGPFLPIDRMEAIQMWVALAPVSVEMGPMVHLTGSHKEPLGGMLSYSGESAEELYPELWERYECTPEHALATGDAQFHHANTWHSSKVNTTDQVRWGMSSYRMAGHVLYTGQQNYNTDGLGLEPNKPFDHPNFPLVYP